MLAEIENVPLKETEYNFSLIVRLTNGSTAVVRADILYFIKCD